MTFVRVVGIFLGLLCMAPSYASKYDTFAVCPEPITLSPGDCETFARGKSLEIFARVNLDLNNYWGELNQDQQSHPKILVQETIFKLRENQACMYDLCNQIKPVCTKLDRPVPPEILNQQYGFCLNRARANYGYNQAASQFVLKSNIERKDRLALTTAIFNLNKLMSSHIHPNMVQSYRSLSRLNGEIKHLVRRPPRSGASSPGENTAPSFRRFIKDLLSP